MAVVRAVNSPDNAADFIGAIAFCGRLPWPLISELRDGDEITACFVVRETRKLLTRTNQPFLRLFLADRTGSIEGVIWEDIEKWEAACVPREIVGVRGRVSVYNERPQLRIVSIERVREEPGVLELLIPASRRDHDLMERELDARIASIRDRPLRGLVRRCLGRDTHLGRAFRQHPAASRNHHAYLRGLLEHTLSVVGICDRLAEHYEEQGIRLDRDLMISGALLHDLGKVRELDPPPVSGYTTSGRLLGHILLGLQIVETEAAAVRELPPERLVLLLHLIASHQGKPEWDSPRVPQTLEALVLHYADDLDAKMNQASTLIDAIEPGEWSRYDRGLERAFFNPPPSPERRSTAEGGDSVIDLFRG